MAFLSPFAKPDVDAKGAKTLITLKQQTAEQMFGIIGTDANYFDSNDRALSVAVRPNGKTLWCKLCKIRRYVSINESGPSKILGVAYDNQECLRHGPPWCDLTQSDVPRLFKRGPTCMPSAEYTNI